MEREVKIGGIYRHFKGNIYQVLGTGTNTETNETMVIYTRYHSDKEDVYEYKIWLRPYNQFLSEVDTIKYPNCKQKYRFEYLHDYFDKYIKEE